MGFSNEYLTEEEKELIAETGHYALTCRNKEKYECLASTCTVDREKKIWLLPYAYDYDVNPKIDGMPFVLFWGNIDKNRIIELSLMDLGEERDKLIKDKYSVDLLKYWSVRAIKVPTQLGIEKVVVENLLEEIMTVYGICGNPQHKGPSYDGKIRAIIKE